MVRGSGRPPPPLQCPAPSHRRLRGSSRRLELNYPTSHGTGTSQHALLTAHCSLLTAPAPAWPNDATAATRIQPLHSILRCINNVITDLRDSLASSPTSNLHTAHSARRAAPPGIEARPAKGIFDTSNHPYTFYNTRGIGLTLPLLLPLLPRALQTPPSQHHNTRQRRQHGVAR